MTYTYNYPRPAVTADCVVITKEAEPKVLLIQRGNEPFKGAWAFPGGFMNMDETTEHCAIRELFEETGLQVFNIQQIGTYSNVNRDPRGRTITVAYLAIIDKPVAVRGQDDAAKAAWWPLSELPALELAFDHAIIMHDAIKRLQRIYTYQKRTTPECITVLQPNEIFVFGSNLRGMHGGGAAYIAHRYFGAIMGQGVGLQGQSYAIPTMQGGVETIKPYVDEFIAFAKQHPTLIFLVTRIGCGIAGFADEEIAPLFQAAHYVDNIVLPPRW